MDVETWSSLPPELLLEIFSRLETTATLSCTGVCKPWRRTIIGNAGSCHRPRPDCFFPRLLLGFLHNYRDTRRRHVSLQPLLLPGPPDFPPAAVTAAASGGATPSETRLPAAISSFVVHGGTELAPYDEVLSSRDGLVLLRGKAAQDRLCLRNLMTRQCTFLPSGEFINACTYVLLTGYDLHIDDGDVSEALILAVKEDHIDDGMTYQIFSTTRDDAWGEFTCSHKFKKGHVTLTRIYHGSEVVCRGGTVHWLAMGTEIVGVESAVGLDVRTRRTWSTELPEGCGKLDYYSSLSTRPARLVTSADGGLSLVRSFGEYLVEVWVLGGGDQWALRRRIDVKMFLPYYCRARDEAVWFSVFCPRSGWLVGHVDGKELLVDAEKGSCCMIDNNCGGSLCSYPYEMDWSTYLARMKHF